MKIIRKGLIDGNTSLVGVIGDPINHSLSPIIHNAAIKELNLNWCYLAIPCKPDNLELVLQGLRAINCKGLNITIPYKTKAIEICNEISPSALEIGAINTLTPNKEGGWNGSNTDILGFIATLKDKNDWKAKKALIIGCGGSARAIVHGLNKLKFDQITIIGRREKALKTFKNTINISSNISTELIGLTKDNLSIKNHIKTSDLIINTTPLGMHNKSNKEQSQSIPLGREVWENLQPNTILYDIIYTPRPTEWLKLGKQYKCKVIDGLEMLIQQGASSLRSWTGEEEIPIEVMRASAEKALKYNYL